MLKWTKLLDGKYIARRAGFLLWVRKRLSAGGYWRVSMCSVTGTMRHYGPKRRSAQAAKDDAERLLREYLEDYTVAVRQTMAELGMEVDR